jgi:pimeloyl-ACP methyl ester carboxylesterase
MNRVSSGRQYGEPGRDAVVLMHGYTGHAHMFHHLANTLGRTYHVICPDALGRGFSSWVDRDHQSYTLALLADQIERLLDAERIDRVRWLGTSMGGMIGLFLAGGSMRERITHLALNDIGPTLPASPEELARPAAERRDNSVFPTFSAFDQFFRGSVEAVYAKRVDDEWWAQYSGPLVRRGPKGEFLAHYDPNILVDFLAFLAGYDLWPAYRALGCRLMIIHGDASAYLTDSLYQRMRSERSPDAILEMPGTGHAPLLSSSVEIEAVERFFAMNVA